MKSAARKERVGVIRFPGTNCDRDMWEAVGFFGGEAHWLWHADRFDIGSYDRIILPGGFSYGDYLRAGALAARSPVMDSVREAAAKGIPILGSCNGFQILCEVGLLPGALLLNEKMRFIDQWVSLKLVKANRYWAIRLQEGQQIEMPIAHAMGRFYADDMAQLLDHEQVWFEYLENPNGSQGNVAGVTNRAGNVVGLMPHPERAIHDWMGSAQGHYFFEYSSEIESGHRQRGV